MSSFPTTIIAFISFITINNGQYFNCTGYYYYSPCYRKTMDCVNDCIIDCIGELPCLNAEINGGNGTVTINCHGDNACNAAVINGGNGDVIINCNGYKACLLMDIYAINANGLQVNGYGAGSQELYESHIYCPQNKYCNIT
eukprot:533654_1